MFKYICKQCNGEYLFRRSSESVDGKKRKYCNYACRNEAYRSNVVSQETRKKISDFNRGKVIPEWHRKLLSGLKRGTGNPMYKHGLSNTARYDNYYKGLNKEERKNATGSYTLAEWIELVEKCGSRCLCCGRKEPEVILTVDHITPLSLGGTNDIGNLQPLCKSCNSKKHTKTVDYKVNVLSWL